MDAHTIAAHRLADALDCLRFAILDTDVDPETLKLVRRTFGEIDATEQLAQDIRTNHPFEPVTDAEKQELAEQVVDELNDMSTRERIEDWFAGFESWELRAEIDDRCEYMGDDAE